MAEIIPDDEDTQALIDTNHWRINFGYIPLGLYGVSLLSLFTIVRYDSIKFLIVKDNIKEAR